MIKCNWDIISLGAGVQSSAMLLMAYQGELRNTPQAAIFCDTRREPQKTYDYVEFLKSTVGHRIEIIIVSKGDLMKDALDITRHRFASLPLFVLNIDGKVGMIKRQCTGEYKIEVYQKEVARIIKKQYHKHHIRKWLGISLDESQRMRLSPTKYVENYYPLIWEKRFTRNDCTQWLIRNGYPVPPKSSCIFCPFHSDEHWQDMKENDPDEFELACNFDDQIRHSMVRFKLKSPAYLHRSLIPLREIDFKNTNQLKLFSQLECSGSCFT